MAKRISELPTAGLASESDLDAVVQSGITRKRTLTQLRAAIVGGWQGFIGTFLSAANAAAARTAIGAVGSADNITGSAAKLTTARNIALTGDVTGSVSFDGSANASIAATVTSIPSTAVAVTAAVGDNDTSPATTAFVQAAIANKRAWTSYTPTITPLSGTYTSATATGSYMVAFGICHVRIQLTVTTKGTGANPTLSLPFAALAGHVNDLLLAREVQVTGTGGNARINVALTGVSTSSYNAADLITADGCVVVITGSYPIA